MEDINVTGADLTQAPAGTTNTKIAKEGYNLELKSFDKESEAGGFTFYGIEYTSLDKAVEKLGKDSLLAALNSSINAALRTKAKSKLSEAKTKEERIAENQRTLANNQFPNGLLLSEQDAEMFVPGARGLTSASSLQKEARIATSEGRTDDAKKLYEMAIAALNAELMGLSVGEK